MPADSRVRRIGLRRPSHPEGTAKEDVGGSLERDNSERFERARARTDARDAAYGWGSARRKLDRRTCEWITALERARGLGELPGTLGEIVREAAQRAGIDPGEVPVEVWRAAGLDHP